MNFHCTTQSVIFPQLCVCEYAHTCCAPNIFKFMRMQIMAYADLNAAGSEAECKAAGKMQLKGKDYTVESGDCIFFHHNATK